MTFFELFSPLVENIIYFSFSKCSIPRVRQAYLPDSLKIQFVFSYLLVWQIRNDSKILIQIHLYKVDQNTSTWIYSYPFIENISVSSFLISSFCFFLDSLVRDISFHYFVTIFYIFWHYSNHCVTYRFPFFYSLSSVAFDQSWSKNIFIYLFYLNKLISKNTCSANTKECLLFDPF